MVSTIELAKRAQSTQVESRTTGTETEMLEYNSGSLNLL